MLRCVIWSRSILTTKQNVDRCISSTRSHTLHLFLVYRGWVLYTYLEKLFEKPALRFPSRIDRVLKSERLWGSAVKSLFTAPFSRQCFPPIIIYRKWVLGCGWTLRPSLMPSAVLSLVFCPPLRNTVKRILWTSMNPETSTRARGFRVSASQE